MYLYIVILLVIFLIFLLGLIIRYILINKERNKAIKKIKEIFKSKNLDLSLNKYVIKTVLKEKTLLINLINLNKNLELVVNSDKYIEIFSNGSSRLYKVNLKDKYIKLLITFGSDKDNKRYINESDMEVCQYNKKYLNSYFVFKIEELEKFLNGVINNEIHL